MNESNVTVTAYSASLVQFKVKGQSVDKSHQILAGGYLSMVRAVPISDGSDEMERCDFLLCSGKW